MEPMTLDVTGRIYKDPDSDTGMYISTIDEWQIATCGRTVDEAVDMTWRLVEQHIEVSRQLGVLSRELGKLGMRADDLPVTLRGRFTVEGQQHLIIR
jgi:hypothetical protein